MQSWTRAATVLGILARVLAGAATLILGRLIAVGATLLVTSATIDAAVPRLFVA